MRLTSFPLIARQNRGHEWAALSASHVSSGDLLDAINDGREPAASDETSMRRLTFWDHKGTTEWMQYDYACAITTASSAVYFYDDTGHGECRCRSPGACRTCATVWIPIESSSGYPVVADSWNQASFDQIATNGLRRELVSEKDFSAGILEWTMPQLP